MKRILACVAALTTGCIMALTGCAARAQGVTVTFYDMGKADAALITAEDGSRILIDAGTNKGGKKLAERFAEEGIERLDAMIITHFDKDHVGGADKILESVSVARVILPQYEKESKQYAQFMEALEQSAQTEREILPAGGEWSAAFGQTRLRVTAAERTDYGADEENDFSLATYVTYGETKFLFPGDAEDARQTELLRAGDIDCDVLKVPYHGRLVDASAAFLAACSPKIAFIPDSDEEAASPMVVAILKELGTDVHSGRDGDLVGGSDGKDVFVKHNN